MLNGQPNGLATRLTPQASPTAPTELQEWVLLPKCLRLGRSPRESSELRVRVRTVGPSGPSAEAHSLTGALFDSSAPYSC